MIVKKEKFINAIRRVSRVASKNKKSKHPTVSIYLEFSVENKYVKLICVDGSRIHIETVSAEPSRSNEESFKACFYPSTLLDLVPNAQSEINITNTSSGIVFRFSKTQKHTLKNLEGFVGYFESFGELQENKGKVRDFRVNVIDLKDALKMCAHSAGENFSYVIFKTVDNALWMAGSDGFRASYVREISKTEEDVEVETAIDIEDARNLVAILPDEEIYTTIVISESRVSVAFENFICQTLVITKFADLFALKDSKPAEEDVIFKADLSFFKKAISFLSTLRSSEVSKIKFLIEKDIVTLTARDSSGSNSKWIMEAETGMDTGESKIITVNASFIKNYLSSVNPSELTFLVSEKEKYPIYLKNENDSYTYLCMPMLNEHEPVSV